VADELTALGVGPGRASRGLVPFSATTRNVYAANLWLRTATRVVVRVAAFESRDLAGLEARSAGIDWGPWLARGTEVRIRATTHRCRLVHTGAVAERLARGAGLVPVSPDEGSPSPPPLVVVRGVHDRFTISIDTSGDPLHRRGWRLATARAPLRPTLAAALLLAAGWDPHTPLIDPLCGSGTIPIEAARLARGLPPSVGRRFAFEAAPGFEPGTWASVTGDAARRARERPAAPILGRDRDEGAIEAATANAARAGVADDVDLRVAAVSDLEVPVAALSRPAWAVTNPPWGGRVSGRGDLRNLYARLGAVCRDRLGDGRVVLLAADPKLAGHTKLDLHELFATDSGGITVHALASG
jgi:putative N6-adenine-specific DNA methylase